MSGPVPKPPHLLGIGENSSHSPSPHLHTPCFMALPPMLGLSDGKLPIAFFLLRMENHQKKKICSSSRVEQKLLYRRKVRRMIWAVSGLGSLEAFSCLPSGSCQRPASSQEEGWNPRVLPADSPNKQLLCSKAASLGAHLVFTATRKP